MSYQGYLVIFGLMFAFAVRTPWNQIFADHGIIGVATITIFISACMVGLLDREV